jgi:hypothetical protein
LIFIGVCNSSIGAGKRSRRANAPFLGGGGGVGGGVHALQGLPKWENRESGRTESVGEQREWENRERGRAQGVHVGEQREQENNY